MKMQSTYHADNLISVHKKIVSLKFRIILQDTVNPTGNYFPYDSFYGVPAANRTFVDRPDILKDIETKFSSRISPSRECRIVALDIAIATVTNVTLVLARSGNWPLVWVWMIRMIQGK